MPELTKAGSLAASESATESPGREPSLKTPSALPDESGSPSANSSSTSDAARTDPSLSPPEPTRKRQSARSRTEQADSPPKANPGEDSHPCDARRPPYPQKRSDDSADWKRIPQAALVHLARSNPSGARQALPLTVRRRVRTAATGPDWPSAPSDRPNGASDVSLRPECHSSPHGSPNRIINSLPEGGNSWLGSRSDRQIRLEFALSCRARGWRRRSPSIGLATLDQTPRLRARHRDAFGQRVWRWSWGSARRRDPATPRPNKNSLPKDRSASVSPRRRKLSSSWRSHSPRSFSHCRPSYALTSSNSARQRATSAPKSPRTGASSRPKFYG